MRILRSVLCVSRRLTSPNSRIVPLGIVLGTCVWKRVNPKVLCDEEKLKPPDPTKLSHSYLIRNAASQTINSALTLLNQTIVALEETETIYTEALEKLKLLLDYNMTVLGDPFKEDHAWAEIIKIKGEIVRLKQQREDLQFVFRNAEKTLLAASEAAFSAGAEHMTMVANDRLFSAKLTCENVSKKSTQLEDEILKVEVNTIERTMEAQKKRQNEKDISDEQSNLEEIDQESDHEFEGQEKS